MLGDWTTVRFRRFDDETLHVEIDPRLRPFALKLEDLDKFMDPTWGFGTSLLAAAAECGCQERRCKNLTAAEDKDTGILEYTHGEGRRSWPRERFGQGLTVDLVDWFHEIHAYEAGG